MCSKCVFLDVLNPTYCYVLYIHQFVAFFYAYPIQTWIFIYLVCLFPLLLFVFTVRFFPLLQGSPVDWSKDKSAQRIQREKVLVVFPVSRGAVPCSRRLCSVFWFRCVVRRQTGAGRRAYLCWYSNKEHDRPCVIPALPTHLSTMLRRPPPQIYAKQMDTAPFTHFPPISVSFTHCRNPTPFNPPTYLPTLSHPRHTHIHTYLNNFSFFSLSRSRDDLKPITLIEAQSHLKWLQRSIVLHLTGQAKKTGTTELARRMLRRMMGVM